MIHQYMNTDFQRKYEYLNNNASIRLYHKSKLIDLVSLAMKGIHRKTLKRYKTKIWEFILSKIKFIVLNRHKADSFIEWMEMNQNISDKVLLIETFINILQAELNLYYHYLKKQMDIQKSMNAIGKYNMRTIIMRSLKNQNKILESKMNNIEQSVSHAWKHAKVVRNY